MSRAIPFELTGTVRDRDTNEPIEGAYVIAGYHESVVGEATATQWCVKTRGVLSDAQGRFRFPVEKLDGLSPAGLGAIKRGYHLEVVRYPDRKTFKRQDAAAYADRKIILAKQDPAKPDLNFGPEDSFCNHGRSAEDVAASIAFLKIELEERIRLRGSERGIEATRHMIERLQSIGSPKPAPSKRPW